MVAISALTAAMRAEEEHVWRSSAGMEKASATQAKRDIQIVVVGSCVFDFALRLWRAEGEDGDEGKSALLKEHKSTHACEQRQQPSQPAYLNYARSPYPFPHTRNPDASLSVGQIENCMPKSLQWTTPTATYQRTATLYAYAYACALAATTSDPAAKSTREIHPYELVVLVRPIWPSTGDSVASQWV